jgi:regulator of nonsense transcripts 3
MNWSCHFLINGVVASIWQIFIFKDKFDGYVFVDSVRGSEYQAIVEYAPFQGLPKSRARKKDKNVGTIENEQHFLNFLDQLKKDEEAENQKPESKIEYSYQIKDDKKVTSTPLIEFLSAKKGEKRDAKV